jgi:hypothetical protein
MNRWDELHFKFWRELDKFLNFRLLLDADTVGDSSTEENTAEEPSSNYRLEWNNYYTFRTNEAEAVNFVEAQPNLKFGLNVAPKLIDLYFKEAQLPLVLQHDPEIPNYAILLLFIATSLKPEQAFEQLDEFEIELWHYIDKVTGGKLLLFTEPLNAEKR